MPLRLPRPTRPGKTLALLAIPEFCIIVIGYYLYSWVANQAPRNQSVAVHHISEVLRLEKSLHIDIELGINQWWVTSHTREVIGNYMYNMLHFIVPVTVLTLLFLYKPVRYYFARRALLIGSGLGLAVFYLWPCAPPRLIPGGGFVDTIARVPTIFGGGSEGMTSVENPYAAMPSLHVGWAVWSCVGIFLLTTNRFWRTIGVLHPLVTTVVIMATGNHLLLDAVGGLTVMAAGFFLSGLWELHRGRRPWRSVQESSPAPEPASQPEPAPASQPARDQPARDLPAPQSAAVEPVLRDLEPIRDHRHGGVGGSVEELR